MHARALFLAALLLSTVACGPKKPTAETSMAAQPVLFGTNNDDVATPDNLMRVGAVAERLKADDKLVVVLVGYTDTSGSAQSNLALSEQRAGSVKELVLQAAGVAPERVLVLGRGETNTTGNAATDRRVEFVFGRTKGGEIPSAEAIVAEEEASAPAVASAGGPPASAPTKGGKPKKPKEPKGEKPREDIVETGLTDVDALFAQVQGLLDLVRGAQDDIAAAEDGLRAALGATDGADLSEALAAFKEQAPGAISVSLSGGKPKIAAKPGAPASATKVVAAMKGLVASYGAATAKLALIPKQSMTLVEQAKALPGRVPSMLKEAGLGLSAVPKTLKAVNHNLKLTLAVPKEAGEVGTQAAGTFKMLAGTFGG